jgi:hypothetical protein
MVHKPVYRVTAIENYRRWISGDFFVKKEWEGLSDVECYIESIKPFESEATKIGTAFHKALELAKHESAHDQLTADEYTFDFSEIDLDVDVLPGSNEITGFIDMGDYLIRGTIDAVDSKGIIDYKTSSSAYEFDKYHKSAQWKLYLIMHKMNTFTYKFFRLKEVDCFVHKIIEYHEHKEFAYPTMYKEMKVLTDDFHSFAKSNKQVFDLVNQNPKAVF